MDGSARGLGDREKKTGRKAKGGKKEKRGKEKDRGLLCLL
jgi:hypothetical protein